MAMLKRILGALFALIAVAPAVYIVLLAPMAWLLLDMNILPAFTAGDIGDHVGRAWAAMVLIPAWFFFFLSLASALD